MTPLLNSFNAYRIVGVFKEYMIDIDYYANILQPFTSNGDVNDLCE